MCKFRDLRADEIECRVQSVKPKGLVLLLYKDARVDMNILDETVGAANWQREHYECKGNLFCRVGIYIPDEQLCTTDYSTAITTNSLPYPRKASGWVWKSDCGTESNTEAQKGEASDSFKRACFNWGIGRELYTSPFIWVGADKYDLDNGKCYDKFIVKYIDIEDKRIIGLEIYNDSKKCTAYTFGTAKGNEPKVAPTEAPQVHTCTACGCSVDSNMAQRTQKAFGVVLCKECGVKRSKGQ